MAGAQPRSKLTLADPLFQDAPNHNFTLKPASPALKRGFNPIDLRRVGVRPKSQRR